MATVRVRLDIVELHNLENPSPDARFVAIILT